MNINDLFQFDDEKFDKLMEELKKKEQDFRDNTFKTVKKKRQSVIPEREWEKINIKNIMDMEKKEVRSWVGDTLKNILKGEIDESIKSNIKMCLHYDKHNGMWASEIYIKKMVDGEWKEVSGFRFTGYFANYWDMVTDPWVCDMVNDITDVVMKNIDIRTMGW